MARLPKNQRTPRKLAPGERVFIAPSGREYIARAKTPPPTRRLDAPAAPASTPPTSAGVAADAAASSNAAAVPPAPAAPPALPLETLPIRDALNAVQAPFHVMPAVLETWNSKRAVHLRNGTGGKTRTNHPITAIERILTTRTIVHRANLKEEDLLVLVGIHHRSVFHDLPACRMHSVMQRATSKLQTNMCTCAQPWDEHGPSVMCRHISAAQNWGDARDNTPVERRVVIVLVHRAYQLSDETWTRTAAVMRSQDVEIYAVSNNYSADKGELSCGEIKYHASNVDGQRWVVVQVENGGVFRHPAAEWLCGGSHVIDRPDALTLRATVLEGVGDSYLSAISWTAKREYTPREDEARTVLRVPGPVVVGAEDKLWGDVFPFVAPRWPWSQRSSNALVEAVRPDQTLVPISRDMMLACVEAAVATRKADGSYASDSAVTTVVRRWNLTARDAAVAADAARHNAPIIAEYVRNHGYVQRWLAPTVEEVLLLVASALLGWWATVIAACCFCWLDMRANARPEYRWRSAGVWGLIGAAGLIWGPFARFAAHLLWDAYAPPHLRANVAGRCILYAAARFGQLCWRALITVLVGVWTTVAVAALVAGEWMVAHFTFRVIARSVWITALRVYCGDSARCGRVATYVMWELEVNWWQEIVMAILCVELVLHGVAAAMEVSRCWRDCAVKWAVLHCFAMAARFAGIYTLVLYVWGVSDRAVPGGLAAFVVSARYPEEDGLWMGVLAAHYLFDLVVMLVAPRSARVLVFNLPTIVSTCFANRALPRMDDDARLQEVPDKECHGTVSAVCLAHRVPSEGAVVWVARSCVHSELAALRLRVTTPALSGSGNGPHWEDVKLDFNLLPWASVEPTPHAEWVSRYPLARRVQIVKAWSDPRWEGEFRLHSCAAFVKSELGLKPGGTDIASEAKPRLVQGATDEHLVAVGPTFHAFGNMLKGVWSLDSRITYAGGLDSDGLGAWLERHEGAPVLMDGDLKACDAHQREGAYGLFAHVLKRTGVSANVLRLLRADRRLTGKTLNGIRYAVSYTNSSGRGWTTALNTVVLALLLLRWAIVRGFDAYFLVGGDDFAVAVYGVASYDYAGDLTRFLGLFGHEAEMNTRAHPSELEFFSGVFMPCVRNGARHIKHCTKPGRFLAKGGWWHHYQERRFDEWRDDMSRLWPCLFNHVPYIGRLVDLYRVQRGSALHTRYVSRFRDPYAVEGGELAHACDETLDWFTHRYSLHASEVTLDALPDELLFDDVVSRRLVSVDVT